jgi:hypothetical protein
MEKNYPNLTINKVPNTPLDFIKKFFFFFIAFFTLTNQSFAQGTTCSNATTVTVNGACSTNVNPNGSDSTPIFSGCGSGNNVLNVGWYRFTVTGGPLNITITAIGDRNLAFQLIGSTTNNCSNLSEIVCVNAVGGQGNGNGTETTTALLANGTYFVKVLNTGGGTLTLASLCVTGIAPEYTVPSTGNNSITTCSGNLYDNGGSAGNYVNNSDGYTVINPSIAGNYSRVSGSITTEGGYDYLTIYDGVGTSGTILWGGNPHGTGTNCTTFAVPTITSLSGSLTVRFYADVSNVCSGFNLAISCSTSPGVISYCSPSVTNGNQQNGYISRVSFVGTLNDVTTPSGYSNAPAGYQNFTTNPKSIQAQGEGINVFVQITTTSYMMAWIDWNKNGSFTDPGEEVYNTNGIGTGSTTFGFIIPSSQAVGDYRIRIRTNNFFGGSSPYSPCGNINNGGETEDYLFTVVASCSANIASITNGSSCGAGPVTLSVTGTSGVTSYKWYTTETGGTAISGATSNTYTTPSISSSTYYYVTALNGTCESLVRTPIYAKINPTPTVTFTPENPIICGDNTIISLTAGGDKEVVSLINEKFESGGLGTFTNNIITSNGTTIDNKTSWQNRTSTFKPAEQVWYPAISSGFGTNKFAMSTSDVGSYTVENQLYSATVNSNNFLNLTLNLRMYYSRYYVDNTNLAADFVAIQVSRNGGTTWPYEIIRYTSDVGIGTKFTDLSFDLSAHINQPNLKIRFLYHGEWCDGVAIDDVELYGEKPLNTAFNYNTAVVDAFQDMACTIPYITGTPITQIFIKPTVTQLENASFNIPVTTTLSNGCVANGSITVTNNTKLFTPSAINSDWNTASNWKPAGVPTASNCIVVYEDLNITGPNNIEKGLNLTIKPGKTLNIAPNNSLVITDFVNVENTGVFQIENNSNLVQINDAINTGNIIYKRTANNIKGSDYVYWSSPVSNQALNSIYTSPSQGPKYSWNATLNNSNGGQGNYVNANGETMGTGIGYLVRGSSSFGMAATNINSTFTGRPNNGTIPVTVNRGSYTGAPYNGTNGVQITNLDDNYNLIGNPYPSSINALQFISDNAGVIRGNVQLWTHGTDPGANNGTTITNPFYGSYSNNYSASDYVTINYTGATIPSASEIIKAGQAFFVEMLDGPTGNGTVNFNNAQRRDNTGIPYANDAFFKNSNQQNVTLNTLERHRIWLDIKDSNNVTGVALIGYIEGATMNDDSAYDAFATTVDMGIYSFIDDQSYIIQGRSLPFDDNDQVQIGFNVPTAGNYTIGLNSADGIFLGTQDIYLKDEMLNIYHDLKSSPYSFTATAGVHNDRFKLVYKNTVLSNTNFNENEFQIAKNKNIIDIVSGNETMDNVKVFDVRGRLLIEKTKINNNSISIDMNSIQDQVLIINIVTTEGIKVTRKIL